MSAFGLALTPMKLRQRRVLPGFGLSLGITLTYLGAIVVLPLIALAIRPWELGLDGIWHALSAPRVAAALKLSFGLPALGPSLVSGVSLAFARAVGEYGSVVFIAGNLPGKTEIAPLLIVIKLEQYDYAGAAAVGLAMVAISFGSLMAINGLQLLLARRGRA